MALADDITLTPLPKLIGVAGRINHGKDWVCDLVRQRAAVLTATLGFGDPLYRAAAGFLGVPEEVVRARSSKDGDCLNGYALTLRRFLQRLGRWAREEISENVLVQLAADTINRIGSNPGGVAVPAVITVTGLRCANEAAWIHRNNGEVWYVRDCAAHETNADRDPIETGLPVASVDRFLVHGPDKPALKWQVNAELHRLGIPVCDWPPAEYPMSAGT